jgi:hypothetical protein
VRLIEIGEAVAALEPELISHEPEIAWADIYQTRLQVPATTPTGTTIRPWTLRSAGTGPTTGTLQVR